MLTVIVKDGKCKDRKLNIQGFVKPSGIVCAKVTTDKDDQYFVVIKSSTGTCTCDGNRKWGHQCYHIQAVIAAALPSFQEIALSAIECAELENIAARRSATPIDITVVRTFKREDAYEQLGESKDPWAGLSEDEKVTAYGYYLMGIGA